MLLTNEHVNKQTNEQMNERESQSRIPFETNSQSQGSLDFVVVLCYYLWPYYIRIICSCAASSLLSVPTKTGQMSR